MRFEITYLAVFKPKTKPAKLLLKLLGEAYGDELGQPTNAAFLAARLSIRLDHKRADGQTVVAFRLADDLENADDAANLTTSFAQRVNADDAVEHFVKFYDTLQYREYQRYTEAIYRVELRLREVLSFIFVDSYGRGYYDLLSEVKLGQFPPDTPDHPNKFRDHYENQFFWLVFSQYPNINKRKMPGNVQELAQVIGDSADFAEFKSRLSSNPIRNQVYTEFLAKITPWVTSIEKLRNCVAHSRAISRKAAEDFETAEPQLLRAIDQFFVDAQARATAANRRRAKQGAPRRGKP